MISNDDIVAMCPEEDPPYKVGDICTVEHSPYLLEQGRIEHIYSSGMVLLQNSGFPAWPVGTPRK